jgi:hypothetical protein
MAISWSGTTNQALSWTGRTVTGGLSPGKLKAFSQRIDQLPDLFAEYPLYSQQPLAAWYSSLLLFPLRQPSQQLWDEGMNRSINAWYFGQPVPPRCDLSTDAAASFTAVSSQYFTGPHLSSLDGATACSVSVWFRPSTVGTIMSLFSQGNVFGDFQLYCLITAAKVLKFEVSNTGSAFIAATGSVVLSAGTLYNAVFVYNGSGVMTFYINGVVDPSIAITGGSVPTSIYNGTSANQPVAIGAVIQASPGNFFNGTIGSVALWPGVVLTSTQAAAIYNSGTRISVDQMPSSLTAGLANGWGFKTATNLLTDSIGGNTLTNNNGVVWSASL